MTVRVPKDRETGSLLTPGPIGEEPGGRVQISGEPTLRQVFELYQRTIETDFVQSMSSLYKDLRSLVNRIKYPPVHIEVRYNQQYLDGKGIQRNEQVDCYIATRRGIGRYFRDNPEVVKNFEKPTAEDFNNSAVLSTIPREYARTKTRNGDLIIDPERAGTVRDRIDSYLNTGLPVGVMVSVKGRRGKKNDGEGTDHWVTINGRNFDENGRLYYSYIEPGTFMKEKREGRFYVDEETGNLYTNGAIDERTGRPVVGIPDGSYELYGINEYHELTRA